MKDDGKTKVSQNEPPDSGRGEMLSELRSAYRKSAISFNKRLDKIVMDGNEIPRPKPGKREYQDSKREYQDIMEVVENNGHVTLPVSTEPWLSRRHIKVALLFLATAAAIAFALIA